MKVGVKSTPDTPALSTTQHIMSSTNYFTQNLMH